MVSAMLLGLVLNPSLHAQTAALSLSFDGGSATATNGYGFTNQNGVTFASGYAGDAAVFNGNEQYFTMDNSANPVTGSFTVTFWMNTTIQGTMSLDQQWYSGRGLVDHEIGGGADDWGLSLLGDRVAFGTGPDDTTLVSNASVTTGEWVFVAATFDISSGDMKLYINGAHDGTVGSVNTTDRNPYGDTSALFIGADQNLGAFDTDSYYNGKLDEINLYTSALTGVEISGLYATAAIPEPGTYAIIAGALALGGAVLRTRRLKKG